VLANEQVAKRLNVPLVRIRGGGEMHNYPLNDLYRLPGGWDGFSDDMYRQAGCGPENLDFAATL